MSKTKRVIFFDGYCGLCNGFVDLIMKIDSNKKFCFSPLQSEYAKSSLPPKFTHDLKTIVVQIGDRTYKKSEAVFEVLKELGGIWKIIAIGRVLPKPLRDLGYEMIAENRYSLFGKRDTCRLPTQDERLRFIL